MKRGRKWLKLIVAYAFGIVVTGAWFVYFVLLT